MAKPGKSRYTLYLSRQTISRVVVQPKRVLEHPGFFISYIPIIESSANCWPGICMIISAIPVDCSYQNPNRSLLFSIIEMKCSNRLAGIRHTVRPGFAN